jgi:hypothetical protein
MRSFKWLLGCVLLVILSGCGNSHEIRDPSGVESTTARSSLMGTSVVSESDQYTSDYQYCLLRQNGRPDAAEQCKHIGNMRDPGPRCTLVWQGWMMYESCPGRPLVQSGSAPYPVNGYGGPYQPRLR